MSTVNPKTNREKSQILILFLSSVFNNADIRFDTFITRHYHTPKDLITHFDEKVPVREQITINFAFILYIFFGLFFQSFFEERIVKRTVKKITKINSKSTKQQKIQKSTQNE